MNNNKNSMNTYLIVGGVLLVLVLIFVGYRVVSVTVGPVTVALDNSISEHSNQVPTTSAGEANPVPTVAQIEVSEEPPQPLQDLNPEISLPFSDNFDNGLNSEWRVLNGQPVITEGKLQSAGDDLVIEIGNNSLNNYVTEFDCCGKAGRVTVTFGNLLRFWFNDCGVACGYGGWEGFADGKWEQLSRFDINDTPGRFRIVLAGNTCQLYAKGGLVSEISYGTTLSGPLNISIKKSIGWSSAIDNFEIR